MPDRRLTEQIRKVIQDYLQAYEARDLERVLSCFSDDGEVVVLGTDPDERNIGKPQIRAQLEKDWRSSDSARMRIDWLSVSGGNGVAWYTAETITTAVVQGIEHEFPIRFSGVAEQRGEEWKIAQMHFSLPAATLG